LIETDLIRDEGWRSRPYKDSLGYLTIGVGHNLTSEGLCDEAVMAQLKYDLQTKAIDPLNKFLPWWSEKPEPVQRVLLNLAFNLGGKLMKWTVTLGHLKENRFKEAAQDIRANHIYVSQVGPRAERLAKLLESV
jgi:lysozyme